MGILKSFGCVVGESSQCPQPLPLSTVSIQWPFPFFPLFLPTNPQILAHALPFGLYWPFLSRFFLLLKTESFLSAFKNRGGFPLPCLCLLSHPFRLFQRVQTDLFCSLLQAHTSQEVSRRLSNQYHKDTGQFCLKPIRQCKAHLPVGKS